MCSPEGTRTATIELGIMERNHLRLGIAAAVMAIVLIAVTVAGYARVPGM